MRAESQELDLEKILGSLNKRPSRFEYAHAMYRHARAFDESAVEMVFQIVVPVSARVHAQFPTF
jgi:hypothetical protein